MKKSQPKARKVEAWAVLREGDGEVRALEPTRADADRYGRSDASAGKFEIVRLETVDPKAEKVLCLVKKWRKAREFGGMRFVNARQALERAVDEMEKKKC